MISKFFNSQVERIASILVAVVTITGFILEHKAIITMKLFLGSGIGVAAIIFLLLYLKLRNEINILKRQVIIQNEIIRLRGMMMYAISIASKETTDGWVKDEKGLLKDALTKKIGKDITHSKFEELIEDLYK